jgi:cystathionine beta-lyase
MYKDGVYSMDYADLEAKAADPKAKAMILCSPHNPAGRVWTRDELTQLSEICRRHNVTIVSDEIHCDLVYSGHKHIPFGLIQPDDFIVCAAPSKTFNLAGIQVANIMVADPAVRAKIDKALNINEVCDINAFAVGALTAAYNQGEDWLEALLAYLHGNYCFLKDFFAAQMPQFPVLPLEGTYLVWVDCRSLGVPSAQIAKTLLEKGNLRVNEGTMYGAAGEGFIRLNIACPRSQVERGLRIIKDILC